jgi:ATP-dependent RNA helicase DDX18/HAS1
MIVSGLVSTGNTVSIKSMKLSLSMGRSKIQLPLFASSDDSSSIEQHQQSFFYSKKDFESIGLNSKVMVVVLNGLRIEKPSKIQALSYNEIYHGGNCILADQTGSGKTLAYLLPVC